MSNRPSNLVTTVAASLGLATSAAIAGPAPVFTLTILHNNDGESQLLDAGSGLEDFGGAARFATLVANLKAEALASGGERGVVMLSSGDNFLAGPEFSASLDAGVPYYDSIAMDVIGYDAICIGNHDFDFGPPILANFINGFLANVPFLSCNLDFSPEPELQALVKSGRIAARTVINESGQMIGIVGATTPDLPFISSPGDVIISDRIAAEVQAEVDALLAKGVNKIILISHLQGIQTELNLAKELRGVDVMIAGGGDELLANPGDLLIPDDAVDDDGDGLGDEVFGPYPITATDADGLEVPVITTKGNYRYVGRLVIQFDEAGNVIGIDEISGPVRVAGGDEPDAVEPDPTVFAEVTTPVTAAVAALAADVIGATEVPLDGLTSSIRSKETNWGNVIADSALWQGAQLAESFGLPAPLAAFQNGGGIRNNSILPIGPLTVLDTFDALPFSNFIAILPSVSPQVILEVLENAVSRVSPPSGFPTGGTGRFAQIAGFSFSYEVDMAPGQRVLDVTLLDGTELVRDGAVAPGAPSIPVSTINFLCTGGDEYPLVGIPFTALGVSYQQALANYIESEAGLEGLISAKQYPEEGEGRIIRVDNPADLVDDSRIDGLDVQFVIEAWGRCGKGAPAPGSSCPADLNDDGVVNGFDLAIVLGEWSFY